MELMTIATAALMTTAVNAATTENRLQLKTQHEYDKAGRHTTRITYAFNGEEWLPALRWEYHYTTTGYTVELSRWNPRRHCFDEATQKTVYTFTPDATAAYVTTYARRNARSAFELTDSLLAAFPQSMAVDFLAGRP
ncbi:MAG: DUF3836 domain-containing protein [Bacteroidaceae bacterium]|nr:DUF3836 domain-containing protein [Bacteroidaceae bacterium]